MKRFSNKSEKRNVQSFEVLTSSEMLQVRGGGNPRPITRSKDILEVEGDN